MSHSCQAIVVRCIDFRLKLTATAKLLAEIGYPEGTYDIASVAGSAKDLLSRVPGEAEHMLKQIDISRRLHDIKEIVILYHDNCGAYGIADLAKEKETETRDLAAIRARLGEKFPDLAVKTYIITGTATGELKLVAA